MKKNVYDHMITESLCCTGPPLVAQMVKNLPAMQETRVRSLGQEDPLEKRKATTLAFLPGKSHGQRSLVGSSPRGHKDSETTEGLALAVQKKLTQCRKSTTLQLN